MSFLAIRGRLIAFNDLEREHNAGLSGQILNLLIVDDHVAARMGLSELLVGEGHEIVASVADGRSAIAALQSDAGIDLILLDIRMPGEDGLFTLETIRANDAAIPVIMLSAYDNPTYVARSAALGANEFLLKGEVPSLLCKTIETVSSGKPSPEDSRLVNIRRLMQEEVDTETLPPELPLTSREAQVLRHLALGLSNKEIALSLNISVETVKEHVQNILRKTGAADRTDIAVRALKLGLIDR